AGGNLIAQAEKTETGNSRSEGEGDPPPSRRAIFHRAGDALRNPAVTPPVQYQRRTSQRTLGGSDLLALSQFWCCGGAVHIHSSSRAQPRDRDAKPLRHPLGILRLRFAALRMTRILSPPLSRYGWRSQFCAHQALSHPDDTRA